MSFVPSRAAAVLFVSATAFAVASPAAAQGNGVETEQCLVLRAMQQLDNLTHSLDANGRAAVDDRERVACGMGMEAGESESWPNGAIFRSGDAWYYPNGAVYFSGAQYYPSGAIFASGETYYYPSGGLLFSGGTWYAPDGSISSETGLVSAALPRLSRERGDDLLGRYRRQSSSFWRMLLLVTLVWEGR